ncbi:MAG: AI-2E family transporter [Betaproteobacteria bacterium]|nr:AI-2E family transporter [Betaproteobacteria bacterium]
MFTSPDNRWYATWLVILAALLWLLWWLTPVLAPFLVAAVMAYVLSPFVSRLDQWLGGRLPRALLVVVVELSFLIVLVALVAMVVPVLFKELARMQDQLPGLLAKLQTWLAPTFALWGIEFSMDPQAFKSFLSEQVAAMWENGLSSVLKSLQIGGSLALALIGNLVLIPVALFYLLLDGQHVLAHLRDWIPLKAKDSVAGFVQEADSVLGEYVRGQLMVMLILSVYYVLGLSLFGLSVAWPVGIFTGLAVFVPYVGFGLGLLLAALAGFLEMPPMQAGIMLAVVFGLGQLIEGFILTPRLIGERIGLHPLTVIFALLAFGQLLGFVGVLIALPASAVLLVAWRRLRHRYFMSRLYEG